MIYSYSKIQAYGQCPFKYKLRYIDNIEVDRDILEDDALLLGTALHKGLEARSVDAAIEEYCKVLPYRSQKAENELTKLSSNVRKGIAFIEELEKKYDSLQFEVELKTDDFIGYIDFVARNKETGKYLLCDFKYSNSVDSYLKSSQLHIYAYYFQLLTGNEVEELKYVFFPKKAPRLRKGESEEKFMGRLYADIEEAPIREVSIDYKSKHYEDFRKMIDYLNSGEVTYEIIESDHCKWCDYNKLCKEGIMIPKPKKRDFTNLEQKKILWFYGVAGVGKTTLADQFPNALFLNTDGQAKWTKFEPIPIVDTITEDRTKGGVIQAWEVLDRAIAELEGKVEGYDTIVLDLVENAFQNCREYVFKKNDYTHEQDGGFGKGYDLVRSEFFSKMQRLVNLPYKNIILISRENTQKDITDRKGNKITAIRPDIQESIINKLAGMVDIVGRLTFEDNKRTLSLKGDGVIFGCSHLRVAKDIPATYEDICNLYTEHAKIINGGAQCSTQEKLQKLPETTASRV